LIASGGDSYWTIATLSGRKPIGDKPGWISRALLVAIARNRHSPATVAAGTVARMEGRLRRVGGTWVGELHGYHVHIAKHLDGWCVWLMPGGAWTERVLRVDSLADGAKLARAWIEKRMRGG